MQINGRTSQTQADSYRRLWLAAFTLFVLAGSTGAWMRFGLFLGFPDGMTFANIRHAHSHLMYFGWVTPALMTLIVTQLPRFGQRPLPTIFKRIITLSLFLGFLAYFPFLFFGYRSATIQGVTLPLSVMAAGFNVIGWYLFAWHYRRYTKGLPRVLPLQLWDTAVLFMLYASLGGWGLPILVALRVENPLLSMAFTHLFLDEFANGWFVLAILGLLYAQSPQASQLKSAHRSHELMFIGLPVLFILGIPTHLLNLPLQIIGGIGGLLYAMGLTGHLITLWRHTQASRVPLIFLALNAITQYAIIIPPIAKWAERAGLRIPYLHWLLLGFVSLNIVAAASREWPSIKGSRWFTAAVIGLILPLLPLTKLWPSAWGGRWTLYAAAWGALLPVVTAVAIIVTAVILQTKTSIPRSNAFNQAKQTTGGV
ncbi:MAG: hypothetical protein Kow0080_01980 [Candidatus Promineifilaceae bacterium]